MTEHPRAESPNEAESIDGILHFDATAARRHKMRAQSVGDTSPEETTDLGVVPLSPSECSDEPSDSVNGQMLSGTELEDFLVNFIIEQTGYPREVVEFDADLEADLGIDSIKKAQLIGELQEYFELSDESSIALDEVHTLRDVRDHVLSPQ